MLTRRDFVVLSASAAAFAPASPTRATPASNAVLPPGVRPGDFRDALDAMRAVVGKENVFFGATDLSGYDDYFALRPLVEHAASAAVAPKDVEEIQRLLEIAADHRIPVWTISTGRNLAYGGPAPRLAGTLVLDLKRMNRIIEVNEKHGYAVVEPGVSYKDLYRHLQRTGSRLWIDCAAPGWGGVVGNLLDRGVGFTPMGEHFLLQQCGMQIVLSDGTIVETGMAAQRGRSAEGTYRYGHGAWLDGLFTQSNFGVVTRLGVQLMPAPPGYRPYMVSFPDEDAIEPLLEVIRPLKLAQIIPNAATCSELLWEASAEVCREKYYTGTGPTPDSARHRIKQDLGIGEWNFYGALYGTDDIMDATWDIIRDAMASIRGARFHFAEDRQGSASFDYRTRLMRGEPNMGEYATITWTRNAGHIAFAPVVPVDGKLALEQYRRVRSLTNAAGFDYFGEFVVGFRDLHHIFQPTFNRDDPDEKERLLKLIDRLIDDAKAANYGIYRTHLDFMDKVAGTYDWNDGALARFNSRLKAAIDPVGILAPGKSGIWPAPGR